MSYSKTQPFDRHGILKILLKSGGRDKKNPGANKLEDRNSISRSGLINRFSCVNLPYVISVIKSIALT